MLAIILPSVSKRLGYTYGFSKRNDHAFPIFLGFNVMHLKRGDLIILYFCDLGGWGFLQMAMF